jgi:hypothetical protein
MANKKLTKEEIKQIEELQQKQGVLIQELGQISLTKINLKERQNSAKEFLAELKKTEAELVKSLEETYGVGSIDLKSGEFVSSESNESEVTETKEVKD